MQIPQDPNMLLSYVNLKLRDYYPTLSIMCDDMDISLTETEEKLNGIGYFYDAKINQFVCRV